ncbi:hypothetical protein WMQ67_09835 [Vibrio harveyi]|uniref:hypothetical protein n=1 Tax=Vibrio harveyi TaxID=669 RepID=UPI0028962063|nr:conserved hypothetical protein [Vibrio harveyi]
MSTIRTSLAILGRPFAFLFSKAETFHYLALTIAIVIGGGWTLYTFDVLKMKESAQSDLVKAQGELEKVKLELKDLQDKIDGTDSSYIEIKTEHFDYDKYNVETNKIEKRFGLIINVFVQNTGTNDVDMSWSTSPLTVFRVESRDGDQERLYEPLRPGIYDGHDLDGNKTAVKNLYLFVGAKKELSFFVELREPGLYYIMFKARTDGSVDKKMKGLGKKGAWFSSKYINIEPQKKPKFENYIRAEHVFSK